MNFLDISNTHRLRRLKHVHEQISTSVIAFLCRVGNLRSYCQHQERCLANSLSMFCCKVLLGLLPLSRFFAICNLGCDVLFASNMSPLYIGTSVNCHLCTSEDFDTIVLRWFDALPTQAYEADKLRIPDPTIDPPLPHATLAPGATVCKRAICSALAYEEARQRRF